MTYMPLLSNAYMLYSNIEMMTMCFKGFDRGKEDISQNKDESSLSMSKSKVSICCPQIHYYGIFLIFKMRN